MTRPYTVVAIPTLFESGNLLHHLVADLVRDGHYDELLILDNRPGVEHNTEFKHFSVIDASEMSFYGMWNWAWEYTSERGPRVTTTIPSNLVLLNDDIKIPEHFVTRLVGSMRSDDDCWCAYPNYNKSLAEDDIALDVRSSIGGGEYGLPISLTPTKGTYKNGGLWGCAFALRGEILNDPLPPIDEQFVIWCGDDDLVKQIDLAGKKTCRVNGLALEHQASTTVNQHPELQAACWADMARYNQKYA